MRKAANQQSAATPAAPISTFGFVGSNNAEIQLPNSAVQDYAAVRSEQLEVLTDLIASQAAGFQIKLSENDARVLSMLAMEFAREMNQVMGFLGELTEAGGA